MSSYEVDQNAKIASLDAVFVRVPDVYLQLCLML